MKVKSVDDVNNTITIQLERFNDIKTLIKLVDIIEGRQ